MLSFVICSNEVIAHMERKESILEKTSQLLDLPGDLVAGLPRAELTGDRELRIENHKGILSCGQEEIHVSGGKVIFRVRGSELELRSMNALELLITGHISALEVI